MAMAFRGIGTGVSELADTAGGFSSDHRGKGKGGYFRFSCLFCVILFSLFIYPYIFRISILKHRFYLSSSGKKTKRDPPFGGGREKGVKNEKVLC
ncbi:hypothetical protein I6N96_13180 [Enterococcus sp. BWM-S5]|uniref:Uncharacterized protein n=1 Tax=Enterococcus larvae TaxID=2794352 RepID=A0ABS4CNA4_9ENTE|nr:hypothetical protein [Enterococcus larvae]MBP1047229.1 hypothetical protein [Enterococcus larvae]